MNNTSRINEFDDLLEALNSVIFGGDDQMVTIGGISKPTISKIFKYFLESGGAKGFNTLSSAQSSIVTAAPNAMVYVGNDPTPSNNGFYVWDGSTLTKSLYDPIKHLSDRIYSVEDTTGIELSSMDPEPLLKYKLAGDIDYSESIPNSPPNYTYVFNHGASSAKKIKAVSFKAMINSVVKIKIFTLSGSDFILSREVMTLTAKKDGLNYFVLGDQSFNVAAGEYIGFSTPNGSSIKYQLVSATQNPMYYNFNSDSAVTVPMANSGKTAKLQIGFHQNTLHKVASDYMYSILTSLNNLTNKLKLTEYKIGAKATPTSGNGAGAAQWIPDQTVVSDGVIKEFKTYSSVGGNLDICVYNKSASKRFDLKSSTSVAVVSGLNTITGLNIKVSKGDYVGIKTQSIGMTQYVSSADPLVAFPIYSGSSTEVSNFAGPTVGYAWQFQFLIEPTLSKKWDGKKYVSFGDSITWYDGKTFTTSHKENGQYVKGYQSYVVDELGCTLDNKGESGWDMTQIYISRISAYDFTDCYLTTITSGANDCRKGIPVGTLQPIGSAFNASTYAGALQASIEKVISSNPNTKIVLITPIRGWYTEYNTANVPNTDPSVVGLMKREYPEMVKSIGVLYGIPVVDFYDELGWNDLNKNVYLGDDPAKFTAYLLHPNNKGYRRMGELVLSKLRNL